MLKHDPKNNRSNQALLLLFSLDTVKGPPMKLSRLSLGLGLVLMHFASPTLTAADETPRAVTKVTFLVIYRPGPAWLMGKPISEQPLKEHGKYMLSLFAKGSMKFAGPLSDNA